MPAPGDNTVTLSSPSTGPDAPNPNNGGAPNRPDNVPEKFWDQETGQLRQDDLLKSYTELERRFHNGDGTSNNNEGVDDAGPDGSADQDDTEGTPEVLGDADAAKEALNERGLDFSKYETEFAKNQQLSDESLTELEKAGIPKQMVDAYIAGQQAVAAQYDAQLFDSVGGEENYRSMVEWAGQNLEKNEADLFDQAVTSGNSEQAMMAVRGLHARYASTEGITPNLIQGRRPGSSRAVGYGNTAEMSRDMQDQRYLDGDPAFHKYVEQRLAATTSF